MECQVCMFEAIDSSMLFIIGFLIGGHGKKRTWTEFVLCNMHISCAKTITIYYKVSYPSRFYIKLVPLLLWGGSKGEFKITIADRESDFLGTATIHNPHPHPTHMHLHLPIKKKWTFFQNVLNYNRYFPTCISSRKAKSIPKYVRNSCRSQKINSQSGWGL